MMEGSNLIFFGDIAIPEKGCIESKDMEQLTADKIVIADLEGPIINSGNVEPFDTSKYNLFTVSSSLEQLVKLNVSYLSLANNHILDFNQPLEETISILKENNIDYFGTKERPYIEFMNKGKPVCIWAAVSYITGNISNKYDTLNEFAPNRLLKEMRSYKKENPDTYLIAYIHWGKELAKYPQPADREWARKAIDSGTDAVIGLHPHVIQGYEFYKNGFICYSIGNFILPQVNFNERKLHFKTDRALDEIGIEINVENKDIKLHLLHYDKQKGEIKVNTNEKNILINKLPFSGFNNKEYVSWFKKHKLEGEYKFKYNLYPTLNSYFKMNGVFYFVYKIYLYILRKIRFLMIRFGFHKPYNW